jgi:hypothetical protein
MAFYQSLDDPDLTIYERSVLGNPSFPPQAEKLMFGPYERFRFLPDEQQRVRDVWKQVQQSRGPMAQKLVEWRAVKDKPSSTSGQRHAAMSQYEIAGEKFALAVRAYEKIQEVARERGDEKTAAAWREQVVLDQETWKNDIRKCRLLFYQYPKGDPPEDFFSSDLPALTSDREKVDDEMLIELLWPICGLADVWVECLRYRQGKKAEGLKSCFTEVVFAAKMAAEYLGLYHALRDDANADVEQRSKAKFSFNNAFKCFDAQNRAWDELRRSALAAAEKQKKADNRELERVSKARANPPDSTTTSGPYDTSGEASSDSCDTSDDRSSESEPSNTPSRTGGKDDDDDEGYLSATSAAHQPGLDTTSTAEEELTSDAAPGNTIPLAEPATAEQHEPSVTEANDLVPAKKRKWAELKDSGAVTG